MNAAQPIHLVRDPVSPEDAARAEYYGLIARLFSAPADDALLQALARSELAAGSGEGDFPAAWRQLCQAASACEADVVRDEFDALFVAVGKPEVMLYGSYYLAGFMHEKPLARLRGDLAHLGLARRADANESEDHISALAEVMRHLIGDESLAQAERERRQRTFFECHIAPWYGALCDALARHEAANFHRVVARFTRAFLDLDRQAFEIEV